MTAMASTDTPLTSRTPLPAVCVIVPALNEAAYIEACLSSLLQQADCNIVELIVVDGGSTDATVRLVEAMMPQHSSIRLMHNPKRIQSAAINLAARSADPRANVLIRADAHTTYSPYFVARCVTALRAHGATSVVVPMRTVGRTGFQRAVAYAQNSRMGNGGAAHRVSSGGSGFVDHGHHAAFDRGFFEICQGYDESFSHNEDAELDYRASRAGGRVWMCAEAQVDYFPRATAGALARQYFRFGGGRVRTLLKHGLRPRLRQIAPVILLGMVVGSFALSFLWWGFALVPLLYAGLCFLVGAVAAVELRDPWLLAAGPAAVIMHLGFAAGFLRTWLQHAFGVQRVPTAA